MKSFSKIYKSLEEVAYASQLFNHSFDRAEAMARSTIDKLSHCIKALDENDSLDMNDEFIEKLTWGELVGALIEARTRLKEYAEREKKEDAA